MNIKTGELTGPRIRDVSVSGFTFRGFNVAGNGGNQTFVIDVYAARNATVVGNRTTDNVAGGIGVGKSVNTTVAQNHVLGGPETQAAGIHVQTSSHTTVVKNEVRGLPEGPPFVVGQKSQDAKVVGNDISGGPEGIFVTDAHGGSFVGNNVHDNCAGMFFEAFGPVGGFEVKGNTVTDNTRSCGGPKFGRKFSGIGIALLGAKGMEVTANHISGNVPSGPTRISGGVVVATDPYFGVTAKPRNNSVIANHFGRNRPDIFWDKSGSGNRFVGNLCNTSVPTRLCN